MELNFLQIVFWILILILEKIIFIAFGHESSSGVKGYFKVFVLQILFCKPAENSVCRELKWESSTCLLDLHNWGSAKNSGPY